MKKFLKVIIVMLFPVLTFAQSNFKPGYVATLKGDTIKGSIDYREWNNNPKSIDFKNSSDQTTTYTLTNTAAFGITGLEQYTRFTLPISIDEIELSRITIGIDTSQAVTTMFLRLLTKGDLLTLYSYADHLKTRYFILDNRTGRIKELERHLYHDPAVDNKLIISEGYKNQLKRYAYAYGKNSPALDAAIQHTAYNNDLINTVNRINGINISSKTVHSGSGTRFFIGAAVSAATLKYEGDISLADHAQNKPCYFPELTAGFDYLPNRNIGKLILRGEAGLYAANLHAYSAADSHTSVGVTVAEQKIQQVNGFICPQIIYNIYNTPMLKAFAGAGMQFNFSGYSNNTYTLSDGTGSHTAIIVPEMENLWLQIPLKAGIVLHNKLEIYGRYNLPTALTINYVSFAGNVTVMSVGFNYLFGIK